MEQMLMARRGPQHQHRPRPAHPDPIPFHLQLQLHLDSPLVEVGADVRKVNEHNVAEGVSGVRGDADGANVTVHLEGRGRRW